MHRKKQGTENGIVGVVESAEHKNIMVLQVCMGHSHARQYRAGKAGQVDFSCCCPTRRHSAPGVCSSAEGWVVGGDNRRGES